MTTPSVSVTEILNILSELGIEFDTVSHEPVMSTEEHKKIINLFPLNSQLTKTLFIKSKRDDNNQVIYFLIILKNDKNIKMKDYKKIIDLNILKTKSSFRFADEEKLSEILKISPGCVTPLAIINDKQNKTITILDEDLFACEKINIHPCINTETISIEPNDLIKYIEEIDKHMNEQGSEEEGNKKKIYYKMNFNNIEKKEEKEMKIQQEGDNKMKKNKKDNKKEKKKKNKKDIIKSSQITSSSNESKEDVEHLGLTCTKLSNFPVWYKQVVTFSEMLEFYPGISGCYILRPWSYQIWELIQNYFDLKIKEIGVKNCYFPIFVTKSALQKEEDHVSGFSPEVAWVTKSGDKILKEPIAIRPTSETVMYPSFAKWIRSHRDLPLLLNQWCNIVRWEFKCPTPFIRSREFLWQEGHCAFESCGEADANVYTILDLYESVFRDLLAVPVIKGKKTEKEKFAGGDYTTSVEAFISATGRGCQGATSHHLGQNFSKMFGIEFETSDSQTTKEFAWQTSWGLTTRTIGVCVMVHGDDKGLVLPPRIAPIQVVFIPIHFKKTNNDTNNYNDACHMLSSRLSAIGIRTEVDLRRYTPGWKFNDWELRGVPIRIELGPKDFSKQQVVMVRRDTGKKTPIAWSDLEEAIQSCLNEIHTNLLSCAEQDLEEHTRKVTIWNDFLAALDAKCIALAPWCQTTECEEDIKLRTAAIASSQVGNEGFDDRNEDESEELSGAAKTLNVPFSQPSLSSDTVCIGCSKPAECWVLFGRSY